MFTPPSLPGDFSAVARVLKTRSAAVRTEDDLRIVVGALDPVLAASDAVWAALSARQKLLLCKHFELRTVFEDECRDRLRVERRAGAGAGAASAGDEGSGAGGLFVLVHGRATVACAGRSLVVRAGTTGGARGRPRKALGRLYVPSVDARDFLGRAGADEGGAGGSPYHRFVSHEGGRGGDVTVRFDKGSTYVVLPESRSRPFLDRLNASLIAKRVLDDVGIGGLLRDQTHGAGCARAVPATDGEDKAVKVFRFRAGQILIKEGDAPDRVLFLAMGSCLVLRENEERETHCVGSTLSPCFVGMPALFGRGDSEGDAVADGVQPVSVVAATGGYAFSFCSICFLASVDKAPSKRKLLNAFRFLARTQMAAWTIRPVVKERDDKKEDEEDEMGEEDSTGTTDDNSEDEQEIIPRKAMNIQQNCLVEMLKLQVDESANENSIKTNTPNGNPERPIELDPNLMTGKLNRFKFLTAIHEKMSSDPSRDAAENDPVRDRVKWLVEGNKDNILSDVIRALSKGCGVDVAKCEGSDPFHDFVGDGPAGTAVEDYRMSLRTPRQIPNRLRHMADETLGRRRPPEYDDSDPFLKPCPSVVSRKMHGKTLPMVRRVKCAEPLGHKRDPLCP